MAGTIKVDTLQSDSNLALKIATANVAFIDATGINVVGGNLSVGGTQFASGGQIQTAGIADGAVTNDKIVSVANTKISGNIVSSQIAPEQTFYGNTVISGTGSFLRLASGTGGIQFGGDTSAANALDDYEEGTWTPAFTFSGGGSASYNTQSGSYTKIGHLVTVTMNLNIASTSGSGDVSIANLPFSTPGGNERFVGSGIVGIARNFTSSLTLRLYKGSGGSGIVISKSNTNQDHVWLQGSDIQASTLLYMTLTYPVS